MWCSQAWTRFMQKICWNRHLAFSGGKPEMVKNRKSVWVSCKCQSRLTHGFSWWLKAPACTCGCSNAFGNLCLTKDFTGCRGFVQKRTPVCQNGLLFTSFSGKCQNGKDRKRTFLPFKAGMAIWGQEQQRGIIQCVLHTIISKGNSPQAFREILLFLHCDN